MKHAAPWIALLLCALAALPLSAAEIAHLRNGFAIAHCSREAHGNTVRLYLDVAKSDFVDLPSGEIASYSIQPDQAQPDQIQPAATAHASTPRQGAQIEGAKSTEQLVRQQSEQQGVDADFLHSVIRQESDGNSRAVSPAGARGLMQLMPQTASEMGVADSFDPEQNVRGGTQYLRLLLERYHGDAIRALAAYNAGPAAVDRYHGVPPYPETRRYVRSVVRDYNRKKSHASAADKHRGAASRAKPALPTP